MTLYLSTHAVHLLAQIAHGARLRDHRDIEGEKWFDIDTDNAETKRVDATLVKYLVDAGLIDSNKKFPAATYWLTEAGKKFVQNNLP